MFAARFWPSGVTVGVGVLDIEGLDSHFANWFQGLYAQIGIPSTWYYEKYNWPIGNTVAASLGGGSPLDTPSQVSVVH